MEQHRPSTVVQADLDEKRQARKALDAEISLFERELREALAAEGAARGHPWLGKKVKREKTNWGSRPPIIQRGVVKIADINTRGYRSYQPKPGEAFVSSLSGHTGYRLERASWDRGVTAWELDQ